MAKRAARKPSVAKPTTLYSTNIYSSSSFLPDRFCVLVERIERILNAEVWLLIQNVPPDEDYGEITSSVYKGFQKRIGSRPNQNLALLIDSPGGIPDYAYRLARLFQRRCRKFTVVVPQYAKSAATLISLGANELILGRDSEMGPLDLQVFDMNQERHDSALNSVQALDRLGAFAMKSIDQTMRLLLSRLPKRTDVILPFVLDYVTKFMKPLLEKVDTTDYTRKSRDLKVAEEYAFRLMRKQYGYHKSKDIARKLVQNFPAHGFVIDREEIIDPDSDNDEQYYGLGVQSIMAAPRLQAIIDELLPYLDSLTAIGRIKRITNG